jgi:hypothetical protein
MFSFQYERLRCDGWKVMIWKSVGLRIRNLNVRLESYRKKFIGKKLEVIIGGKLKNGSFYGKSEFYFDVKTDGSQEIGSLVLTKA